MRRREFISLLGGAAVAWPLAAHAQQPERMRLIGILLPARADDADYQTRVGAFLQAMALLGWTIGRNVRVDTRWTGANAAEIRRHAAELVALVPDVILAHGTSTVGPLLQESSPPIVFPVVSDPVAAGFVDSLARPGGNATGFMTVEYTIGGKYLELLKQIAPGVTRVAVLRDPTQGSGTSRFAAIQAVAPSLRIEVNPSTLATPARSSVPLRLSRALQWRPDHDDERVGAVIPRSDHHASGAIQAAGGLLRPPSSSPLAAWFPMVPITSTSIGSRPATSIASSRARSRPTFRCRRRPSTSW